MLLLMSKSLYYTKDLDNTRGPGKITYISASVQTQDFPFDLAGDHCS